MYFPGDYSFSVQLQLILAYRKANNCSRATMEEVAEDLHTYNCNRLGNDPKWCRQVSGSVSIVTASPSSVPPIKRPGGCSTCGARIKK